MLGRNPCTHPSRPCLDFTSKSAPRHHERLRSGDWTILYYTILYYTILYYTILYYTILYYTILYYTLILYTIYYILYTIYYILDTIYYVIYTIYYILYHTILHTTLHYTTLCYTILYSTLILYTHYNILGYGTGDHRHAPYLCRPTEPPRQFACAWSESDSLFFLRLNTRGALRLRPTPTVLQGP